MNIIKPFSLALASSALLLISGCEPQEDISPTETSSEGKLIFLDDERDATKSGASNAKVGDQTYNNGPGSTNNWLELSVKGFSDGRVYTGYGSKFGCPSLDRVNTPIVRIRVDAKNKKTFTLPPLYKKDLVLQKYKSTLTVRQNGEVRLNVIPAIHLRSDCDVGKAEPKFSSRLTIKKKTKSGNYYVVDYDVDNWSQQGSRYLGPPLSAYVVPNTSSFGNDDGIFVVEKPNGDRVGRFNSKTLTVPKGSPIIEFLESRDSKFNLNKWGKGTYRVEATVDRQYEPARKLVTEFYFAP